MAINPTTPPKKPEPPKPSIPTIKDFETWVAGRTGLTQREFFDAWVGAFNLTPAQREALWAQVKKEQPKPPTPKPPTPPTPPKPPGPIVKPELIIHRKRYPPWWDDLMLQIITLSDAGTQVVVPSWPGYRTFIASITFTVSGETNITLDFGVFGPSGSMDFGASDEPRGIQISMGDSPAPCGQGNFSISSDGVDVAVGGFAVYYHEKQ